MAIRKIIAKLSIFLIYLFFIMLTFFGFFQVLIDFAKLPLGNIIGFSAISLIFGMLLLNGLVMTFKFDKNFRDKIIQISSQDALTNVYPISFNLLLKTRLFRGCVYLGGIYFHYMPLKPAFASQRYLINDSEFIKEITPPIKIFAFIVFLVFVLILIAAFVSLLKGLL